MTPDDRHDIRDGTQDAVRRCQTLMAHAWMVRTFVKHSLEAENFPELMEIARTVFDVSRALETKVSDPADYLLMLRKKMGKLRRAAEQFRHDAPLASVHTNFQQAVISLDAAIDGLESVLRESMAGAGTPSGDVETRKEAQERASPA